MTTTADLIDICSLYFAQSAAIVSRKSFMPWYYRPERDLTMKHLLRCSMYALSARLILEGVY